MVERMLSKSPRSLRSVNLGQAYRVARCSAEHLERTLNEPPEGYSVDSWVATPTGFVVVYQFGTAT